MIVLTIARARLVFDVCIAPNLETPKLLTRDRFYGGSGGRVYADDRRRCMRGKLRERNFV